MRIFYFYFYRFYTCVQKKYYLQIYLDNCAYKVIDKQIIDYLDDNHFKTDED